MSKFIVVVNALNVRTEPSIHSNVSGVLNKGEVVVATEGDINGYWIKVKNDRVDGWASHKYLSTLMDDIHTAINAPWFEIAKQEIDEAEVDGVKSNPRIVEYLKSTTLSAALATTDETPWCSAFVNFCVEQAGYAGTDSAAALSWLNWGRKTDTPMTGDIVVFERGAKPHGHVAFYVSQSDGAVRVLGGNQGNRVCYASFPVSKVLDFRTSSK